MDTDEKLNMLYKVAEMHFVDGLSKAEIAGTFKKSATHIADLIKEAKKKGIVSIKIRVPSVTALEISLLQKFPHLVDALVVPYDRDCGDLLKQLGQTAAEYFEKTVTAGKKVAIGGGYLMYEMVSQLEDRDRDIDIYPIAMIGRGPKIAHIDPVTLVTLLWAKSGRGKAHAHYVTVTPPDSESREEIAAHYKNLGDLPKVQRLLSDIGTADFVFVSVGGLDAAPEYLAVTEHGSQNLVLEMGMTKEELQKEGAVGDIGYSFFDEKGRGRENWTIGTTLGLDGLKRMSASKKTQVVAVVGAYKLRSLETILKNGYCNVLITDSKAANYLVNDV